MRITITKRSLGQILALVQLYGEFLHCFKCLSVREEEIHKAPEIDRSELEYLLRYREQVDLALTKIVTELSEKHRVCIPGPDGWETPDPCRFFEEPIPF